MKKLKVLVHFKEMEGNLYSSYLIKPQWDSSYTPETYDRFVLGGHTRKFMIGSIFNHIKALVRLTDEIGDEPCLVIFRTMDDKLIEEVSKEPIVDDRFEVIVERIGR